MKKKDVMSDELVVLPYNKEANNKTMSMMLGRSISEDNNYRAFTILYKKSSAEIWAKSRESAMNKAQSHFKVTANQRNNIRVIKEFDALMMG